MNSNNRNTSVSQKRLRELADRALRVVDRHQSGVGIKAAAGSLVPAAEVYVKAYDALVQQISNQGREMERGRQSVVELDKLLKSSLALVKRTDPSFDMGSLTASLEKPDQVIGSAGRVIELLSSAGQVPESHVALIEALKVALDKAKESWDQAQASRVELQQSRATVRAHAVVFNRELVALRCILRVTEGTRHLDYQALRVSRTHSIDDNESDDSVVEDTEDDTAVTGATDGSNNGKGHTAAFDLGAIA